MSEPLPVLSRSAHDRAAHLREDPDRLAALWPDAAVLTVAGDASAPVADRDGGVRLGWTSASGDLPPGALFLGLVGEQARFALPTDPRPDWRNLRDVGDRLDDLDAGLLTAAVALVMWHERHRHCPRCGASTTVIRAGWARQCDADGSEHFPRTDPAVIMLVHDGQGRCILGRQAVWPEGRFSVLAGFVEAGESPEAAVAREVGEEVGVRVRDIRYVASQPWPFPQSLMLGYTARLDGAAQITRTDQELAEAGWFTREQIRRAATWGESEPDTGSRLRALPGPVSIARQLIDTWLANPD